MSSWPTTGEKKLNWISRSQRSATQIIAPGDEIDLQIWDGSESPLLGSVGQKSVGLQKLVVDSAGQIFVPYLDQVKISGSSPEQARQGIQDRLAALIPSAQVQLGRTAGRGSSVDLVGGVGQAGNFPMPDQSFTVLSLIAQAGGVAPTLKNPQIRLMRGGNMYGTSVARLFAEPSLDTTLRGGDKVFIEEDKRYFLSLGAAGSQSMYIFTQDSVSALDAMSIIGGVSSSRADPQGILILREYPASAVVPQTPNADGTVPVSPNGPGRSRVVFTLDLTSADGLFSAKNFRIASGDLVLVTESPITRVQTIFGLIGSSLGLARQVDSTVN